ncbi:MAG: polysaccharide deacetylase family protein [Thermomicrobiales bacterium]
MQRINRHWGHFSGFLAVALLSLTLAACGGGGANQQSGEPINWKPGTPPGPAQAPADDGASERQATSEATQPPADGAATNPAESATSPTAAVADTNGSTARLTQAQLEQFKPDEVGVIPVLEYHDITTNDAKEDQFTRPVKKFKADLQWLYDHNFFVIPMKDLITDNISAPAGKHPAVLTFDDSMGSQFRYIINDDGTKSIDPDSVVGILEAFYGQHPDFGRGGLFSVLPYYCFNWKSGEVFDDQTPFCQEKITWLLDHGYEIGNHTQDHQDLADVDDDAFKKEIGQAILTLQALDPRVEANILAMPKGNYPDKDKHPQQRDWLANGFDYNGKQIKLIGSLMVGAQPSYSPVSSSWDPVYIYRIQAFDGDWALSDWFARFEAQPANLYTSDGNPNTVTLPAQLPPDLQGTFDEAKAADKEVIRY